MITNISIASVFVKDVDESKAFYIDVLGFDEHTDITLGDGLPLVHREAPEPARAAGPPDHPGPAHLARPGGRDEAGAGRGRPVRAGHGGRRLPQDLRRPARPRACSSSSRRRSGRTAWRRSPGTTRATGWCWSRSERSPRPTSAEATRGAARNCPGSRPEVDLAEIVRPWPELSPPVRREAGMKGSLRSVDPLVFWGSAIVIAVFVVWGLAAPENLGTVMARGAVLDHRQLRLGVHPDRVRGAGAVHLPGGAPVGPDPARARRLAAGVPDVLLDLDDVRRRARRRPAVLRHRRADLALVGAAARAGRAADRGSGEDRAAVHLLPLGLQRVGAVRGDGRRDGLLRLPQGHADPGQRDVHAGARAERAREAARSDGRRRWPSSPPLFGTATSLGLNGLQLNSGLQYLFGMPEDQRDHRGDHRRWSPRCS